jgi:DNA-binding XRE family transcriptional regulator
MTPEIKYIPVTEKQIDCHATGAELKKFREDNNVSQEAVASKIGISRVALLFREQGKFNWTAEHFEQYVKAVNQLK